MKTVRVAAAVIRDNNRIFATARGYGAFKGKWSSGVKIEWENFPGSFKERNYGRTGHRNQGGRSD